MVDLVLGLLDGGIESVVVVKAFWELCLLESWQGGSRFKIAVQAENF
mgnify:CR=1 FL=1